MGPPIADYDNLSEPASRRLSADERDQHSAENREARPSFGRARLVVLLLVGLPLIFLALENVALWSLLGRVQSQADIRLGYRHAYMLWPGRVHLSKVEVSGGPPSDPWHADAARLEVRLGWLDLIARNGHIAQLRGTNVRVALGQGTAVAKRSEPAQSAPPEVDPPVKMSLDGAALDTPSKLTVDRFDLALTAVSRGDLHARGAMRLSGQSLQISAAGLAFGETEVAIKHTRLSLHEQRLGRLHGKLNLRLGASPRAPSRSMRDRLTAHAALSAEVAMAPLASWLGLTVNPSVGSLEVDAGLEHGVLEANSHARLETSSLRLIGEQGSTLSFNAGAEVRLSVAKALDRVRLELSAPVAEFGEPGPAANSKAFRDLKLALNVADRRLEPRLSEQSWQGSVGEVRWHLGAATISGPAQGQLEIQSIDPATGTILGSGQIDAPRSLIDAQGLEGVSTKARATLDQVRFSPQTGLSLTGSFQCGGQDALALLALIDADRSIRMALHSLRGQPFELESPLEWRNGQLRLSRLRLTSGPFSAEGAYAQDERHTRLALLVHYGKLAIGVSALDGKGRADFTPASDWLETERRAQSDAFGP